MRQSPALQVDEGALASRMHYFEDERMSVCARQMEVVVVFARQRPRGGLQPVKFARQASGLRFGHRLSYAGLQEHAPNLIRKSRSASIPDGLRTRVKPRLRHTPSLQTCRIVCRCLTGMDCA